MITGGLRVHEKRKAIENKRKGKITGENRAEKG